MTIVRVAISKPVLSVLFTSLNNSNAVTLSSEIVYWKLRQTTSRELGGSVEMLGT